VPLVPPPLPSQNAPAAHCPIVGLVGNEQQQQFITLPDPKTGDAINKSHSIACLL
jgi:hypothetical protein